MAGLPLVTGLAVFTGAEVVLLKAVSSESVEGAAVITVWQL